jgi:hypothetical protein
MKNTKFRDAMVKIVAAASLFPAMAYAAKTFEISGEFVYVTSEESGLEQFYVDPDPATLAKYPEIITDGPMPALGIIITNLRPLPKMLHVKRPVQNETKVKGAYCNSYRGHLTATVEGFNVGRKATDSPRATMVSAKSVVITERQCYAGRK